MSRTSRQTAGDIVERLQPGMSVFLPGLSGESLALHTALTACPEKAEAIHFVGVHFPGVNRTNYIDLNRTARQTAFFMQPQLRRALAEGRVDLLPIDYPKIFAHLRDCEAPDIAVVQVAPPNDDGLCSLGPAVDFQPAVWGRARFKVAHVNPRMPDIKSCFSIRLDDCDAVFEADAELVELAAEEPTPEVEEIGKHVASLVRDRDTVQFGIGKIPTAVLRALSGHRKLKIHSGMICEPVLDLVRAGAMDAEAPMIAGVALGSQQFYEALVSCHPDVLLWPVSETHDVRRIADIPGFVAINTALEVDLFGQVNADMLGGRQLAGVGGLPAFVQGAALSAGGRSIICIAAAARDGAVSRIVPKLGDGSLAAITRADVDYVVTEHGVARLRGLSVNRRGEALMAIAAPQFRAGLESAWTKLAERI